jgi:hypothetical protein
VSAATAFCPSSVSGHEEWRLGVDGLIAGSLGQFDGEDCRRQLERS